jgi:putative transposase
VPGGLIRPGQAAPKRPDEKSHILFHVIIRTHQFAAIAIHQQSSQAAPKRPDDTLQNPACISETEFLYLFMHFEADNAYHVYNRGNEKQPIFFAEKNYLFFLQKVRYEWLPYADVLAYCLMPNHFHFIIVPNQDGCQNIVLKEKETHLQVLSKAIGKTLSSYTQAINIEQHRTGNLFQKKTKAKCLTDQDSRTTVDYLIACIHYIHNNAYAANLIDSPFNWPFCSLKDYAALRSGTLCNMDLLYKLSGLTEYDFKNGTIPPLNDTIIKDIF